MLPTLAGVRLVRSAGPPHPMASMPRIGLRAGPVWRYEQGAAAVSPVLYGSFTPQPNQQFALAIFPDLQNTPTVPDAAEPNRDGCRLGVAFDTADGMRFLSDQHDHPLDGTRQCLVPGNWNLLRLDLDGLDGELVNEVRLEAPAGLQGAGWLQVFGVEPKADEPRDAVDHVRTLRGTHSGYLYSRGNTLPQVCVPHGFNFLTPLTEARDRNWLYGWHRDGGPVPRLQGLAINHTPSPWIGDRGAFQVMPFTGTPTAEPDARAIGFHHADELDRPHLYSVRLEDGTVCEMTATSHVGFFRFTFPADKPHGVVLDHPRQGRLHTHALPDGRVAFAVAIEPDGGWQTSELGLNPPTYVYGESTTPCWEGPARERRSPLEGLIIRGRRLTQSPLGRFTMSLPRRQAVALHTDAETIEVRVAVSFISPEQARKNFALEARGRGFDEVADASRQQWAELLDRLTLDGGTLDQRITAWSNLARLYSWPNEHHENLGSSEVPDWGYASPYTALTRHSPEHTGSAVVHGQLLVNNGYWDTFRTCWPLYSLLTPARAPQMLDGILQQFRDGGWMARWAAPGYIDCMPGTTSDAIFAEASCHQTVPDELGAYDATLRNATVPSDDPAVGRKGLTRSRFVGWTDIETDEGLAWTMDAASCDAAIALWSRRLADRAATDPLLSARADEFAANHRWFLNRSLAHQAMFDPETAFYRGRRQDGRFRTRASDFDPLTWGLDYTETNAWGQAFHAPHDGAGLARLLGGEDALAAKLDTLLTTPAHTHPGMWGGYLYNTQEMNEAEADGIGQLAISNQPAHHIPFMYLFTGQHHTTQWLTRELLDKKFVGSEIGQGYPGDEDNGSMSGYWLCLAMGLFPLFPGSGKWVITTPLFKELSFQRDNGRMLRITTDDPRLRYIAALRVNGEPWHEVSLPIQTLLDDIHLDFELSATPTTWAQQSRPLSTSQLTDTGHWQPDRTTSARLSAHAELIDDRGHSDVPLQAGESLELRWEEPFVPRLLTLTRVRARAPQLRIEIRDTQGWTDAGITPRHPRFANQTQAYLLPERPVTGLRLTATAPTSLSQIEVY